MNEYVIGVFGYNYVIRAIDEQTARDLLAMNQAIGREICSCGESFWGERGVEMHAGPGHGEPTLEELDGYFAKQRERRREVARNAEIVEWFRQ